MSGVAVETNVEQWELHSELVLVSPDVCRRALELLPERDPDAFLPSLRQSSSPRETAAVEQEVAPALPFAIIQYTFWRLADAARVSLITLGSVVVLVTLLDLLR
jgi:hypothetical protein